MEKRKGNLKIFISYSWRDKDIVEQIDKDLQTVGITLIRDIRDIEYRDSIKQFMKKIRFADYVLMIISDSFLKSHNCMFEVLEFVKDENFRDRILPITLLGTDISTPEGRLLYLDYWQKRVDDFEEKLKKKDLVNTIGLMNDLRIYKSIAAAVSEFLAIISDMLHVPIEELRKTNYRDILKIVGFDDSTLLEELLSIKNIDDQDLQDIALTDFMLSHSTYAPGYLFSSFLEKEKGNFKKSEYFSSKAIELKPEFGELFFNRSSDSVDSSNFQEYIKKHLAEMKQSTPGSVLKKYDKFDKLSHYAKLLEEFEFDFNIASKFQHSFLPKKEELKRFEGVRVDYFFEPLYKISGDYIDLLKVAEDVYGFFIAEISGQGVAASLIGAILKVFMSIYAKDVLSPQLLMDLINQEFFSYLQSGEYLSCFYGVYFSDEKKLVYANANHLQVLLQRAKTMDIIPLNTEGFFVGVFKDSNFEEKELFIEKGDRLFLYTDGIVEARNSKDEEFGDERLKKMLNAGRKSGISELISTIKKAVSDFSGGIQKDDLTMIVVEFE